MVKAKGWAAAGALSMLTVAALFFLWPGDAARIRKQLDVVSESLRKTPDDNPLMAAANAKRIRAVVAPTVAVHAPAYDYRREIAASELPALILSTGTSFVERSLSFYDDEITFPAEDLARVRVTARMRGRASSGEWTEDIQELHIQFQKSDDAWRIAAVDVAAVLQK